MEEPIVAILNIGSFQAGPQSFHYNRMILGVHGLASFHECVVQTSMSALLYRVLLIILSRKSQAR